MKKLAMLLGALLCVGALAGCGSSSKYPKYDPAGIIENGINGAAGDDIRKAWPKAEFRFDNAYYIDTQFFGHDAQAFAAPNEKGAGYSIFVIDDSNTNTKLVGSDILEIATEVSKDFGKPKIKVDYKEVDSLTANDINFMEVGTKISWDWDSATMYYSTMDIEGATHQSLMLSFS